MSGAKGRDGSDEEGRGGEDRGMQQCFCVTHSDSSEGVPLLTL